MLDRLLGIAEVEKVCGISRQTIWRHVDEGKFPAPNYVGNVRKWPESAIKQWLDNISESAPFPYNISEFNRLALNELAEDAGVPIDVFVNKALRDFIFDYVLGPERDEF